MCDRLSQLSNWGNETMTNNSIGREPIVDRHAGVLGFSGDRGLLRQCAASGQMEAGEIVAHRIDAERAASGQVDADQFIAQGLAAPAPSQPAAQGMHLKREACGGKPIGHICPSEGNACRYPNCAEVVQAGAAPNCAEVVQAGAATKDDFPYDRTFQAIAAAVKSQVKGVAIEVSVKAFIEAWNAHHAARVQAPARYQCAACDWQGSDALDQSGDHLRVRACPKCLGDVIEASASGVDAARGLSGEAWSAATKRCFDTGGNFACADVSATRCTICHNKKADAGVQPVEAQSASVTVETLRQHWLRAMECDHATGRDKPHCACSLIDLGWHPSIGAAVEAWLAHVAGASDCTEPNRAACPRRCIDFCNKAEEERERTSGVAVDRMAALERIYGRAAIDAAIAADAAAGVALPRDDQPKGSA